MKSILKEPLLHFLLIGVALFLAWSLIGARPGPDNARIVVTGAQVDRLAAAYARAWRRPPDERELQGLIDDWVHEEIAVREAVAAGLDRDDTVIRRRLRQKFEVIAEEQDARDAPTEADLAAHLARHAERYTAPATVSFDQIALDEAGAAANAERAATLTRTALQRGSDPARLGKATMLPGRVESARLDLVAREFGPAFADQLSKLPLNEWAGPVRSAFGAHLVRVTARAPGTLPPLDAVRAAVARELESERRVAAQAESYRKLRERYDVVIEAKEAPAAAAR